MASLFKPTITRHVLDGKVVSANTPGAHKIRTKAEKWYGRFRDASGKIHRVPLATNKEAATAMLAEAIKKAERSTAGLTDPFEEARKLPVSQHVADFRRSLESKGSTSEHVTQTANRLTSMMNKIKANRLDQLSASRVADWLAEQRRTGMAIQTSNYYLSVAKQFGGWLMRERRLPENPFVSLQRLNARADIRRERRAFSEDELARLVTAANNGPEFRGLTGADRALLYVLQRIPDCVPANSRALRSGASTLRPRCRASRSRPRTRSTAGVTCYRCGATLWKCFVLCCRSFGTRAARFSGWLLVTPEERGTRERSHASRRSPLARHMGRTIG